MSRSLCRTVNRTSRSGRLRARQRREIVGDRAARLQRVVGQDVGQPHRAATDQIEHHPGGRGAGDDLPRLVQDLELAVAREAAPGRGPGAHEHRFADPGVAIHRQAQAREDPREIAVVQVLDPDAQERGVLGCRILQVVQQGRRTHEAAGTHFIVADRERLCRAAARSSSSLGCPGSPFPWRARALPSAMRAPGVVRRDPEARPEVRLRLGIAPEAGEGDPQVVVGVGDVGPDAPFALVARQRAGERLQRLLVPNRADQGDAQVVGGVAVLRVDALRLLQDADGLRRCGRCS